MDVNEQLSRMNIPEKEIVDLLRISKVRTIESGALYISEGQTPQRFAIVLTGLFRYYYIDDKGNDFTKSFIRDNSVLISYSAMVNKTPAYFYIEALEDGIILDINYRNMLGLQEDNRFWDKFLISSLEKGYYAKEKRERELLLLDAETRYKIFVTEFPDLVKKVKLQMIASYLGIKPESLSRIRKKISV